jgi:hypothetical protein
VRGSGRSSSRDHAFLFPVGACKKALRCSDGTPHPEGGAPTVLRLLGFFLPPVAHRCGATIAPMAAPSSRCLRPRRAPLHRRRAPRGAAWVRSARPVLPGRSGRFARTLYLPWPSSYSLMICHIREKFPHPQNCRLRQMLRYAPTFVTPANACGRKALACGPRCSLAACASGRSSRPWRAAAAAVWRWGALGVFRCVHGRIGPVCALRPACRPLPGVVRRSPCGPVAALLRSSPNAGVFMWSFLGKRSTQFILGS